ncbi:Tubulin specific chaperone D [Giardia muris]|uniref:Tubulin specific chaperone D n=1 Tax=Giardia muris TaxID=5742 RepID=A0A4Z1SXS8_GIAMU|nr:Tubulin specific chaperone D [Giardia muris]|eukprot:TNJ30496.1 Tubulin specific chaperone D [Giardia muris]
MKATENIEGLLSLSSAALCTRDARQGFQKALRYNDQLRAFLEAPYHLDVRLPDLINPLIAHLRKDWETQHVSKPWLYSILYSLIDVRGLRPLTRFFPNEVMDLERCVFLLKNWYGQELVVTSLDEIHTNDRPLTLETPKFNTVYDEQGVSADAKHRVTFVLFVALSVLVGVPFDIASLDSTGNLVDTVAALVLSSFDDGTNTHTISTEVLARLATRPDLRETFLPKLLMHLNGILSEYCTRSRKPSDLGIESKTGEFDITNRGKISACLMCISYCTRFSDREHLLHLSTILEDPMEMLGVLLKDPNRDIRRLCIVLSTRLSTVYLPQRNFLWRQRVLQQRSRLELKDEYLRELDGFSIPDEFDYYVTSLLTGLQDDDTGIRLASAKGFALVVGRLPFLFANELVEELLHLFSPAESPETWHGAGMALGEIIRCGLLMPERISQVSKVVAEALRFERQKSGVIVRDTACFIVWSLSRAYHTCQELMLEASTIAANILVVALFDREVNIRRAAAAAFQELAGRVREPYVPSAIKAAALVDYYALGSKKYSYQTISLQIAELDQQYLDAIVTALHTRYVIHLDGSIRTLAAQTLASTLLVDQDVDTRSERAKVVFSLLLSLLKNTDPEEDWMSYCGYLLAISNCVREFCNDGPMLGTLVVSLLRDLWDSQESLFKQGKRFKNNADGSFNIICATSTLISNIAQCPLEYAVQIVSSDEIYRAYYEYLLSVLEYSILVTIDSMSIAMFDTENTNDVILALRALAALYSSMIKEQPSGGYKLSNTFFKDCINSAIVNSTLATLAALGLTPEQFLVEEAYYIQKRCYDELKRTMAPSEYVTRLYVLSTIEATFLSLKHLSEDDVELTSFILSACLTDFGSDQRGDVGSLVRLKTFRVLRLLLSTNPVTLPFFSHLYKNALVMFLGSRIDIMRIDAVISLYEDLKGPIDWSDVDLTLVDSYMCSYEREKETLAQMRDEAHKQRREDFTEIDKHMYDLHQRELRDDDPLTEDSTINILALTPHLSYTALNILAVVFLPSEGYGSIAANALVYVFGVMSETVSTYMMRLILELTGKRSISVLVKHVLMGPNSDKFLASIKQAIAKGVEPLLTALNSAIGTWAPGDQYKFSILDSALSLLDFLYAYDVHESDDEIIFERLSVILKLCRVLTSPKLLKYIVGIFASGGAIGVRNGFNKARDRCIRALILMMGHRVTRVRQIAAEALLELLLIQSWLPEDSTEDAVLKLTACDWHMLDQDELEYSRALLCQCLSIDPPPAKKSSK